MGIKELWNGLVDSVLENPDWWLTAAGLSVSQPIFAQIQSDAPLSALTWAGLTNNFILFLMPTIFGCLVAVYKSKKEAKERWVIVVSSLLFNGYILESIYAYFSATPNSAGYFFGGLFGFVVFDLLFQFIEDVKPKGMPLLWRFFANKADGGLGGGNLWNEDDYHGAEEDVPPTPKRRPKKGVERH